MAVTYNRHNWNNNGAPAINATNLNGIEQGLVDVIRQANANEENITANENDIASASQTANAAKAVTDAIKNINGIVQSNGDGTFTEASGSELLPEVAPSDAGKILTVSNEGTWEAQTPNDSNKLDTPITTSISQNPRGLLKGESGSAATEIAKPNVDYISAAYIPAFNALQYGVTHSDINGVYPANSGYDVRKSVDFEAVWEQKRYGLPMGNSWVGASNIQSLMNGEVSSSSNSLEPAVLAFEVYLPQPLSTVNGTSYWNSIEIVAYLSIDRLITQSDDTIKLEFYNNPDNGQILSWSLGNELNGLASGWYSLVLPIAAASSAPSEIDYSFNQGRLFAYPKSDTGCVIALGTMNLLESGGSNISVTPATKIMYDNNEETARYYSIGEGIRTALEPEPRQGYTFMGWRETNI